MKKIIAKEWRSAKNTVGIVAVEQFNGRWRAYIGPAFTLSEDVDAQNIADNGAKLNKKEAIAFFPYLDSDKFDKEI